MKEDQKDIYFVTGDGRAAAERSPVLERLKALDYEVSGRTDLVACLSTHEHACAHCMTKDLPVIDIFFTPEISQAPVRLVAREGGDLPAETRVDETVTF